MSALEWRPAVAAVTGNATYRLYPKDNDGPFTIKFVNWNGAQIGATQSVAKGSMPNVPEDPTKPALDDVEFIFAGWSPEVVAATAAATYTATFTEQPITYTILWKNYDGATLETDENVAPNAVPQYNGATPTKPSDETYHYTFSGWSPTVVAAAADAAYIAQFTATPKDKIVNTNEPIESGVQQTVTNLIIETTGTLTIPTTSRINATNLILEATSNTSGQLITNAKTSINVTGNAYFDLKLNTDARHWHAFGVPWIVDVTEYPAIELETGRTLTIGRDYEIVSYNGATRASQGAGAHCWDYLKHYNEAGQPVDVMTPGKGYMIAFTRAIGTVRFTKATGAPIFFTGSNSVTGGAGEDGGWNAIANPMAYHATLSAGPTVGYVHDGREIGSDGYTPYDISGTRYIVGKMVYVQAGADQAIVVNPAGSAGEMTVVSAPKRRAMATDKQYLSLSDYYTVALTNADGVGSKVYILPEEDKANEYVIGHDLSQFSMSNKKAQIWVNRYDTKLALNTTAPIADVAEFPVSLYAPVAGEYTITNTFVPDDEYIVYLTLDGEAIWNLSDAAYTITLDKGTVNNYGLRLNARKAPSVATGIDEAVVDAKGETRKVMINDQVYIIRGENVYSVDGQLVR
ncbi:MAG: hypothetical protein IKR37_05515, partial [Paludibacteraceae bacterium]|nr:hypothetical protein [Paludibacteraceae bacterium]